MLSGTFTLVLVGLLTGFILQAVSTFTFNARAAALLGAVGAMMGGGLAALLGWPGGAPFVGVLTAAALILGVERYRRRVF
jgi:uncharacterized membrane protein YeaQ/YmgE (transglycosylase-associated protein family)